MTVVEHYRNVLSPIYAWMLGGMDAALARGTAEVSMMGPLRSAGDVAIDLGAGMGVHAIPLALAGWRVIAIDQSPELLALLRERQAPSMTVIEADLTDFRRYSPAKVDLVLCMGDTLTHLPDAASVTRLFSDVAAVLGEGGRFVATFRDHSQPLQGAARFIPVRSDNDRIQTCFLEEAGAQVIVHDLVYDRVGDGWQMRVGSYPKLRLAPGAAREQLRELGLSVTLETPPGGMVRLVATRERSRP